MPMECHWNSPDFPNHMAMSVIWASPFVRQNVYVPFLPGLDFHREALLHWILLGSCGSPPIRLLYLEESENYPGKRPQTVGGGQKETRLGVEMMMTMTHR